MLKIVLTGGPSSGKTSVLNKIRKEFEEFGYGVIIVSETATELINSGIRPYGENALNQADFQDCVLNIQNNKENIAIKAAKNIEKNTGKKVIIMFDRGMLDGYAYVLPEEWNLVLQRYNYTKIKLLTRYDAVLYLRGAKEFFTKENNQARYEANAEEGLEKGEKVLQSYLSHDNLVVIKPRERIEDKQQEVVNMIHNMLGNPTRMKEQRKFLVDDVKIDELSTIANKVLIEQDYLLSDEDNERRIRKVTQDAGESYYYTVQRKKADGKREIIEEKIINNDEYEYLLKIQKDNLYETIKKIRYSFVYKDQYYKLDIFPDDLKILEVNVTKENPILEIPEFIGVIEEVTNNPEYSNISISRRRETTHGKRKININ